MAKFSEPHPSESAWELPHEPLRVHHLGPRSLSAEKRLDRPEMVVSRSSERLAVRQSSVRLSDGLFLNGIALVLELRSVNALPLPNAANILPNVSLIRMQIGGFGWINHAKTLNVRFSLTNPVQTGPIISHGQSSDARDSVLHCFVESEPA
jgi:hypothetical protein